MSPVPFMTVPRVTVGSPSVNGFAAAYITRVELAGGVVNPANTAKLSNFYSSLETSGLIPLLNNANSVLYAPVEDSDPVVPAAIALDGFGQQTLTLNNFVTGNKLPDGLQGDGSFFIETDLGHGAEGTYFFAEKTRNTVTDARQVGFRNVDHVIVNPDGSIDVEIDNRTRLTHTPSDTAQVYRVIVTVKSLEHRLYFNGSLVSSELTKTNTLDSSGEDFEIFRAKNLVVNSQIPLAGFIGTALTQAQVASLDAAIQLFA